MWEPCAWKRRAWEHAYSVQSGLANSHDCSLPGLLSMDFPVRILEWVAVSPPGDLPTQESELESPATGKQLSKTPNPGSSRGRFLTHFLYKNSGTHHTIANFPRLQEKKAVLFLLSKHHSLMVSMKNVLSVLNFGFRGQLKHGCVYITL